MRFSNCLQVLVSALAAVTQAQTPATAPDAGKIEIEEVVITGSRIALPNMVSTSPIQVITEKDIRVSGKADISDIILQLPQNFNNSFSDFNNRTSGLTTAGGLATADLRGLGPQRTLVLVNGRRLGVADANTANPNPAADLDQIPTDLIERVDVVTGGASATYGSDAIAGVINFIMKRNFEGIQFDGQLPAADGGGNFPGQATGFSAPANGVCPAGQVEVGAVSITAPAWSNWENYVQSLDFNVSAGDQIRARYVMNRP